MKAVFAVSTVLALQVFTLCTPARAVTFGFTEGFTSTDAGWRGITTTQLLDHHLTGGVDNGGYVDIAPINAVPASSFMSTNGAVVFRAGTTASGGAFAGNWLDAGISTVQAYLRHDLTQTPVEFYVRLTNGPAAVFFADQPVGASDGWTLVNFEISPANFTPAGGTFAGVLPNVQNFQIGARITGTVTDPGTTNLLFDVDQVSLVPEPSTVLIAFGAIFCALPWRRFRVC
jgi:hypothetical protein